MAPAGEIWSVVIESPTLTKHRAFSIAVRASGSLPEAIGLLCDYPISRVVSTLRLCGTDLKKHQAQLNDTQSTPNAGSGMAFMELEASQIQPSLRPVDASLVIELQRPDGLRLRVESANTTDLVVLAERFMGV